MPTDVFLEIIQPNFGFILEIFVAVILLGVLFTCYVKTPQYTSKIVAGFGGDFKRTTTAGFSLKLPAPFETVVYTVDLTLQVTDFDVNIKTKDDNFVDLPVQIQYEIADAIKSARLPDLAKRKRVMQTLAQNVIRGHFAEGDLQKIYTSRNEMAELVRSELQKNMEDYGLIVRDVVVENPKLPEELQGSMQSVVIADRKLEAARKNAEANKVTIVAQAEGEQALLTAKAAGEKARLLAQAEGEGAIRVAQAEAEKKARLALGEGVAGEQVAIAKGFHESVDNLTAGGISAPQAMDYLMMMNRLQYNKQNIEALADAYGRIRNAVLFADIHNPAGMLGDADAIATTEAAPGSSLGDVKALSRLLTAVEALRPAIAPANPTPAPTAASAAKPAASSSTVPSTGQK